MQKTYSEKLRDPRWQKKRLEILNRDKFTCCMCSDSSTELHIHHKRYDRNTEPWDYQDSNYVTFCKNCHAQLEELKANIGEMLCWEPCYGSFSLLYKIMQGDEWSKVSLLLIYFSDQPKVISGLYDALVSVFQHGSAKAREIDAREGRG